MKSLFTVLLCTCLTLLSTTTEVSAQNIDPIYGKSFVGIWKRMFVSGRPEQNPVFLYFNQNANFGGPIGPASRRVNGYVKEVRPDRGNPNKGLLIVEANGRRVEWSYTLNRNNGFKQIFRPFQGTSRRAPVLNELLLVGQGTRQLYAFLTYPWKPVIRDQDCNRLTP